MTAADGAEEAVVAGDVLASFDLEREVAIKEYFPSMVAVRHGGMQVRPRSPEVADDFARGRDRFLEEARTLALLERTSGFERVDDAPLPLHPSPVFRGVTELPLRLEPA